MRFIDRLERIFFGLIAAVRNALQSITPTQYTYIIGGGFGLIGITIINKLPENLDSLQEGLLLTTLILQTISADYASIRKLYEPTDIEIGFLQKTFHISLISWFYTTIVAFSIGTILLMFPDSMRVDLIQKAILVNAFFLIIVGALNGMPPPDN